MSAIQGIDRRGSRGRAPGRFVPRGIRRLALAAGLASIAVAVEGSRPAGGLWAQAAASGEEPGEARAGCFRGRPLPGCRSFWIVEMQASTPIAQTTAELASLPPISIPYFGDRLEWNLGYMVNLTPKHAVGGVVTAGTGGEHSVIGLKLRGRRWLSEGVSAEMETGLLLGRGYSSSTDGVTVGARLNIRDQGSFFLRWDGLDIPRNQYDPSLGGFQQALSVGAGLGSRPALIGTAVVGLGTLILLVLLFNGDNWT